MKRILFLLSAYLIIGSTTATAQDNYTISGYMRDSSSGEELLFAGILVKETGAGTTTNVEGFYSLTLPEGNYTLEYSYVGMQTREVVIELKQNITQDIELNTGTTLVEIKVQETKDNENITSTEMGVVTLDMKDAKLIPVLLGEQDILKTIQLLPGVSANSEGSSGFFVRGGDADQNLILLDDAPVYNASHLLGFFSVFNSDALKDVKLYKGGMPSKYGGRVSSVLDIRMKNGNMKKWEVSGGVGLISSRITAEGPLKKDKGSIIISGRRTYLDLVAKPFLSDNFSDLQLYFYDINAKANYKFGTKDRIYISGYFGRDVFGTGNLGFDWGNATATARWNHLFSDQLFLNTTFVFSDYRYGFGVDVGGNAVELSSGIQDYNLKQHYYWYPNPKNTVKFGWEATYHILQENNFAIDDVDQVTTPSHKALETGVYIGNEQKIVDKKFSAEYGVRLSSFSNIGAFEEKVYDEENQVIQTNTYNSGEFYKTYFAVEPRVNMTYVFSPQNSLKASYTRNYQFLHLLSNSTSGTPTDLWIPSTPLVKPQIVDQVALGYFQNFGNNAYEFSVETYYKQLYNQVDFEDGGSALANTEIESDLAFGKGRAYGVEFFLKKKRGKFTGWLSYTLAKSERQFDAINNGNWFSARQDRTHDISLVAMYQISKRLNISASFIYYTGDAVTYPVGKYTVDGASVNLYGERNAERMPDYHRLDLGLTYIVKDGDRFYSDLSFSIYNAYNRKNAYSITFDLDDAGNPQATRLALFGIVPSITWNFKFR
ncbi:MAG: TonB-dependent receptor [Saprospiraceae bacterium]|nr:TonB-dependent receptor [Saprospiraceae bacterium]